MTTTYIGKAGFKKTGVGTVPANAPTVKVITTANAVLATGETPTALSNAAGVYVHSYVGADGLDVIFVFETADTTMDAATVWDSNPKIMQSIYDRIGAPAGASIAVDIAALPMAVWNALTSALVTAGSIGKLLVDNIDAKISSVFVGSVPTVAQIWNYTWRTLTTGNANGGVVVESNTIQAYGADTFHYPIEDLGSLANYATIYFTVKATNKKLDSEAIFQVSKKVGGVGDGLLYVNGAVASDATKGSITIDDATTGDITVDVDASIFTTLKSGEYFADVKIIRSVGVAAETLREFTFKILDTITKAIS